jgi:hypothetical protein
MQDRPPRPLQVNRNWEMKKLAADVLGRQIE